MVIKFSKKRYNISIQLLQLNKKYTPQKIAINRSQLSFEIKIRPTEMSKIYIASFSYELGKAPKIYLKNQGILKNELDKPPHCYERKFKSIDDEYVRICLYYPNNKEWNESMLLSDTIIPWTIEWLYFYEVWRVNGKWLGGGHENEPK